MALISVKTILTSLCLFHITLAYFFYTNPNAIAEQVLVYVLGEAMGMVSFPSSPVSLPPPLSLSLSLPHSLHYSTSPLTRARNPAPNNLLRNPQQRHLLPRRHALRARALRPAHAVHAGRDMADPLLGGASAPPHHSLRRDIAIRVLLDAVVRALQAEPPALAPADSAPDVHGRQHRDRRGRVAESRLLYLRLARVPQLVLGLGYAQGGGGTVCGAEEEEGEQ